MLIFSKFKIYKNCKISKYETSRIIFLFSELCICFASCTYHLLLTNTCAPIFLYTNSRINQMIVSTLFSADNHLMC